MAMTREERSWVMYDWANSAYSMIITTAIFPIYFKSYIAVEDGVPVAGELSTAWYGYANTGAALVTAFLAPVLGALADHRGKKPFFMVFFVIGIVATLALAASQQGAWLTCLIIYAVSHIGFYGAVVFYDAYIVDVATPERRDWISASAFGWGYIGGTIPFLIATVFILYPGLIGVSDESIPPKLSFVIAVIGWSPTGAIHLAHLR